MIKKLPKDSFAHYFSSFIFGVEDSLVSTVGLLSGVAVAGVTRTDIFITGIILIFVEAFSMGVGNFLLSLAVTWIPSFHHLIQSPSAPSSFPHVSRHLSRAARRHA